MRVLDLFSGIGGFSVGLERAGFRTVAFCEIDPYCRAVLARHWPGVPILGDIRELTAKTVADATRDVRAEPAARGTERERTGARGQPVDVICGGFPCQDISVAGKGAGLAGARSGLWYKYHRLIRELRPRYAIVENVSALLSRGLEQVLGDLAAIGYDAEWHCIPASHLGAPHRRDRIWIVAYPDGGRELQPERRISQERRRSGDSSEVMAHTDESGPQGRNGGELPERASERFAGSGGASMAISESVRCVGRRTAETIRDRGSLESEGRYVSAPRAWFSEPDVGRVAHGVPSRVDRLRALGNAVVPQVVEVIGRAIMRHAHGE